MTIYLITPLSPSSGFLLTMQKNIYIVMSSSRVNHSCPKEIVHAISHYYYTYLPMIFPNNQYFHRQTTCQNGSLGYRYICFGFRQFKTRYLKFIEFAEKENVVKFSTITPRNIVQNQVAISGCPTVDLLNHLSKVFIISQAQLGGALAPPWLLGGELSPAPPWLRLCTILWQKDSISRKKMS